MNYMKKIISVLLVLVFVLSSTTMAFATDYTVSSTDDNVSVMSTKSKAIVIIPGILGSSLETTSGTKVWLHLINYGKMELTETGTSAYSIVSANYDNYGANNTYKTLYNELNNAFGSSFDVIFFDYDFRLSNTSAASKLASELSGYSEVVLVAHSMGGLVASKYLANSSTNRSKTTAFISLGTPYLGAAKCIDVMESGEMIGMSILGINVTLFKNTIKNMSKNCYAAYQLLPTSKYYSVTGYYPVSVSGTNYSNATTVLKNTAWGKKSDGTVKPMFSTATTFHSSLYTNNVHVKNFSDVTSYTLAATGEDTIAKVSLDSNYEVTALTYSNLGDETVLKASAGLGTPNYTYTGTTHTGMVSDSTVISRVKKIITAETGVSALSTSSVSTVSTASVLSLDDTTYTTCSTEIESDDEIVVNEKGWMLGRDNRRINIYADSDSTVLVDGVEAVEENCCVYNSEGVKIGSVWELGSTGRKMYALYNGNYEVVGTDSAKIEYMDNGYYESGFEYSSMKNARLSIGDHKTKKVKCRSGISSEIQPSSVYSSSDLLRLNK